MMLGAESDSPAKMTPPPVPTSAESVEVSEEQALESVEMDEPAAPAPSEGTVAGVVMGDADEDSLLDSLEEEEAESAAETEAVAVEEVTLESSPDEQTVEGAPLPGAVEENVAVAEEETEEVTLTPEEAQVLRVIEEEGEVTVEMEIEEEPEVEEISVEETEPEPVTESPAPGTDEPAQEEEAIEKEAGETAAPGGGDTEVAEPVPKKAIEQPSSSPVTVSEGELSEADYEILVRFLAMM